MDDKDYWNTSNIDDLWLFDKLILSRKLGYLCGPAGVSPPKKNIYIVRPCCNYRMMSKGAVFMELSPNNHETVPDGYFWCEVFEGRHLSFDYSFGNQILAVEGFREDKSRLDRFCMWKKIEDNFKLPDILFSIACKYDEFNIEVIEDKVIEVHLRHNDDFIGHDSDVIIPIWKENFHRSECGDRLGFLLQ